MGGDECQQVVEPPVTVLSSQNVCGVSPMERLDRNRRLRRAMAAKEATLRAITRFITAGNPSGDTTFTATTDATAISRAEQKNAVARAIMCEHNSLGTADAAHAEERARLEKLVHDLRWELEAAGNTLRNQASAIKLLGMGMTRMDPYRIVRTQRQQQQQQQQLPGVEHEKPTGFQHELDSVRERVKVLENALAERKLQCDSAEKRTVKMKNAVSKITFDKSNVEGVDAGDGGGNLSVDACIEKSNMGERYVGFEQSAPRETTAGTKDHMDAVRSLEGAYLTARRSWKTKEKEFKRYIQILENTIVRIERRMPREKANRALLFNMRLVLVSCEKLLNRRNNGVGFIDPFVVVYGLTGEKALETLPREDTDSPKFSEKEDAVTLKVARMSPWDVIFEVYSRGANNARLFLGQAKIPAGSLLETAMNSSGAARHSVKLSLRDRETDAEIIKNVNKLGVIFFDVAATVVGIVEPNKTRRGGNKALEKIHKGNFCIPDGENQLNCDVRATEVLELSTCSSSVEYVSLRVAAVKGISIPGLRPNCSPYVLAYDSCSGEELLRTVPAVEAKSGFFWENDESSTRTTFYLGQHGNIIFHVYDHNRDGKDDFLGKTCLSKNLLRLEKEWHELKLDFFEGEPSLRRGDQCDKRGQLLVQCTRTEHHGKGKESGDKAEHPNLSPGASPGFFDTLWSSKVLREDLDNSLAKSLIPFFHVQITVEACRGLFVKKKEAERGVVFVRVVAPDLKTFVTSALPYTENPTWNKKDNSLTTMALRPLGSSLIGFYVVLKKKHSGERDNILGYAQLAVVDLFFRGFGRKELQLIRKPEEKDVSHSQHAAGIVGSVVVSFALSTSPFMQIESENEATAMECGATVSKVESPKGTPTFSLSSSATATSAAALSLKKGDNSASATPLSMRIYVKGGHDLLDCDQMMFNVFGATDPRVMVWVGPDHVFTVPGKRDTVSPRWEREEGEFVVSVHAGQVIRFEVQDVDVAGFDSMGCATILASEVIASPGEHSLPVMHFGRQYGTLDVLFALDKR